MGTATNDQISYVTIDGFVRGKAPNAYLPKRDPAGSTLGILYSERATFLEANISPSLSYESQGCAFLLPLRIDFRGLAGCPAVGWALEDEGVLAGVCGRHVAGRVRPVHGSPGRERFRIFGVSGT